MKVTDDQIVGAVIQYRKMTDDVMGPSALGPFARFISEHYDAPQLSRSALSDRLWKLIRGRRLAGLVTWDCPDCGNMNVSPANTQSVGNRFLCADCHQSFDHPVGGARLLTPSLRLP